MSLFITESLVLCLCGGTGPEGPCDGVPAAELPAPTFKELAYPACDGSSGAQTC